MVVQYNVHVRSACCMFSHYTMFGWYPPPTYLHASKSHERFWSACKAAGSRGATPKGCCQAAQVPMVLWAGSKSKHTDSIGIPSDSSAGFTGGFNGGFNGLLRFTSSSLCIKNTNYLTHVRIAYPVLIGIQPLLTFGNVPRIPRASHRFASFGQGRWWMDRYHAPGAQDGQMGWRTPLSLQPEISVDLEGWPCAWQQTMVARCS